jgi:hypothetical protein
MFSLPGFLVLRTLAERQGVTDQNALNKVSLIGGMAGLSPVGIIVGKTIIDREVESATTTTTVGAVGDPTKQAQVPNVVTEPFERAETLLKEKPFEFIVTKVEAFSSAERGKVIAQDPHADLIVPVGSNVTLTVSQGDEGQADEVVKDKVALVAGTIEALSDEVKAAVPNVGPHVVAMIQAVRDFARDAAKQTPDAQTDARAKLKAAQKELEQTGEAQVEAQVKDSEGKTKEPKK